mgnify:CR=1 FL=1
MNTAVIEFNQVWKKFRKGEKFNSLRDMIPNLFRSPILRNKTNGLEKEEFWVLKDVNFEVKKGDVVGIIGPNGAGKSTILKLLSGIMAPNRGGIIIKGKLSALIEVAAGFHDELTGRENVYLNGTILGMRKKEIDSKFDEIVEFSGLSDFIDTPVKRYSSGMHARLGFSVAAHMDPDILVVDEVLAVGDMAFQAKCANKMRQLFNSGATIVLVSHNLLLIQNLCKRVILLNQGQILREGTSEEIIPYYQNLVYGKTAEELKKKLAMSDYMIRVRGEILVKISNVLIHDGKDNRKESFNTGEEISIRVEYEAKEKIENPIFSLDIIRADQVLCCSSNTKDDGVSLPSIQGKGLIEINLGRINLAPGIYVAKISLWDSDMIHSYSMRRKEIFRIEQTKFDKLAPGVFLPQIMWRFDGQ